jgi:hypothetical protein
VGWPLTILARQRNVQQQNELSFEHMHARAEHFRGHGVPIAANVFWQRKESASTHL